MNYDALLNKFANTEFQLNPAMQSVMDKVRTQGLHKAASVYGLDSVDLRSVVTKIGADMYREQMKYASITSGLSALNSLAATGDIKLANLLARGARAAAGGADDAARALGDDAAAAASKFDPKATIAGDMPALGHLPQHPKSMAGAAGKATPPPVPGAAAKGPSVEGIATQGNPGMPSVAEMKQLAATPPPIPAAARKQPAAGAADDLWAAPKGPSPFSGQGPAGPARQARPPRLTPGQTDPNLEVLMNNMGGDTKGQLGRAFGIGADQVGPEHYMRAAHGVPL